MSAHSGESQGAEHRLAESEPDLSEPSHSNWAKLKAWATRRAVQLYLLIALSALHLSLTAGRGLGASENNHFAYLAQAWLGAQLHLQSAPPHGNDWASYELLSLEGEERSLRGLRRGGSFVELNGARHELSKLKVKRAERRYFVSFPPLPALVMLPLVWRYGLEASDTLVTVIFAVMNGLLCYALLGALRERGWLGDVRPHSELWLVTSLSLGSAHLWCASLGQVWFTALVMGVTFQLLYLKSSLDTSQPLRAGLWLSAAFATRPTLVILSLFFYGQLFSPSASLGAQERWRRASQFSVLPALTGGLLLWHNYARFGAPLEFGHSYLAGGRIERIAEYGLFHWVFLKKNLIAAFALLPLLKVQAPYLTLSMHGMAIQCSSPSLLWALRRARVAGEGGAEQRLELRRLLYLCIALIFTALSLYQNTGWVQYSWRFILDLLPALTLVIALNGRALSSWFKAAVLWGVAVNLIGALTFARQAHWFEWLNLPILLPS